MKNILSKTIGAGVIATVFLVPVLFLSANDDASTSTQRIQPREVRLENRDGRPERATTTEKRLEIRGVRMENRFERASSTEMRLENRENNIERIRARIASTTASSTASTSEKRLEKMQDRMEKQKEQMNKMREKMLEREFKAVEVLEKIASKIAERITILEGKSLDMTAAKAKLAEATAKLAQIGTESDTLTTLTETEITEANQEELFTKIKDSQVVIKALAKETHALLVDTIKEITKVLPQKTATSTATSTN